MPSIADVKALLDFGGKGNLSPSQAMVTLQTEGVAALCNILDKQHVAYLADEVGLGKTMQALGVIAMLRDKNPEARVLIVTPREIVQEGWFNEFDNFCNSVYKGDKLPAKLSRKENIISWIEEGFDSSKIMLLRHTSFGRPAIAPKIADQAGWSMLRSEWQKRANIVLSTSIPSSQDEDRSYKVNMQVAAAIAKRMECEEILYDLIIVDEAQCLRNSDNQTNQIFHRIFQGRVKNWLFMSATPAHSGIHNLKTVLNHYSGRELLAEALFEDDGSGSYKFLLEKLSTYMIRRPRTYHVSEKIYVKKDYRVDDKEKLALTCDTPLSALTIGLVQKKLVDVLESDNVKPRDRGKFKAGYMASFESLDDSWSKKKMYEQALDEEQDLQSGDFYQEKHHKNSDDDAPDSGFVSKLAKSLKEDFGMYLPHPKIDSVADELSLNAFGCEEKGLSGGVKTLVFCRRISSVDALRDRIMNQYIISIENRCLSCWKVKLDWDNGLAEPEEVFLDDAGGEPTLGNGEIEYVNNKFRLAGREKGWLHRYRATFEDGNRNALIFEENWFARLCKESGVSIEEAIEKIPHVIWQEAFAFSSKGQQKNRKYKRKILRYITWHCLERYSEDVFMISRDKKKLWIEVLNNIFPNDVKSSDFKVKELDVKTDPDVSILNFCSFWDAIDLESGRLGFNLPGRVGENNSEKIYERQILKTILYRYLLLSDSVIDLYFADKTSGKGIINGFVSWFASENSGYIDAIRLRKVFSEWIDNRALIFRSAYNLHQPLSELAAKESYEELYSMEPVMAITGGMGDRKRLVKQFNTPGMPFVVVGTDTLREGVNLHLFCKRVMHFGVAWTSGDLEQRVGRVDRYFSMIERQLKVQPISTSHDEFPKLYSIFPYLRDTLEKRQIEVVLERKRQNEKLMDSPLVGLANIDHKEISIEEYIEDENLDTYKVDRNQFSAKNHI